jgi:hypothetical protein
LDKRYIYSFGIIGWGYELLFIEMEISKRKLIDIYLKKNSGG